MRRLLAVLPVFALAALPAATPPAPDDRGRPVILMVHGRGMLDRDTAGLRQMWFTGLMDGGKPLVHESPLAERDVRLVWYADVLDPRSSDGCDYVAGDRRAKRDAAVDPNLKTVVSVVGGFLNAITSFVADTETASPLRALAADASFLGDQRKRCASEQRLANAIEQAGKEGRPVIIVAHSLGSIVAYDYLSTRNDKGLVWRLVTVGSMVGSADLRRLLIGGDSTDTLEVPNSVSSWVNIRNNGDPLAAPLSVARDITTTAPPDETDHHEMIGYLKNSVTAGAVLSGWCAAFTTKQPAACAEILHAAQ